MSAEETKKEKRERKLEKKAKKQKTVSRDDNEPEKSIDETEKQSDKEIESDAEKEDSDGDKEEKTVEELEIDLNAGVPLSKKQQRLLKKGKLNLEKIAKKNPPPKRADEKEDEEAKGSGKSPFGVWIGNLSYDTTKEDIIRFIVAKTAGLDDDELNELVSVKEKDITRVNLPKKANKIKGFAYVDLPGAKLVDSVVSLSESPLNGRKLLIKNSSSFEGRPEAHTVKSVNPPSRILFVGNLSFDTTEDNLEEHFRHCGDIVKIRMATFEDSGKCKGFAFIDFKDESGPTTALKSKLAKKLINRPLRLEFGEDRSKRAVRSKKPAEEDGGEVGGGASDGGAVVERSRGVSERSHGFSSGEAQERPAKRPREATRETTAPGKRLKSSVALASAQRASAAIVPSMGKKTTFD